MVTRLGHLARSTSRLCQIADELERKLPDKADNGTTSISGCKTARVLFLHLSYCNYS